MRVVVTGGHGFLGHKLALRLLAEPDGLTELVLVDSARAANEIADDRVTSVIGDVTDPDLIDSVIDSKTKLVYHLASVVSAGAEQDFDLGYAVNLHGTILLLERCRTVQLGTGRPIRLVFASSVATYGPVPTDETGAAQPARADAQTAQRPETSYGVQKACCELLINDYHRKGFVDGWVLRLPTVSVRPGRPNLAASGFASGIIREPLNGVDMTCPVSPESTIAVISPGRVIHALHAVASLDTDELGSDRTVLLPGLPMTPSTALAAVEAESGGRDLGAVTFSVDPDVQRIVESWPGELVSERAEALGLFGDSSVAAIVRQHITEELER